MPVPTETLRNIRKLNLLFALTAVAGAASLGWLLWADYNRPWRVMQNMYFNAQSALAHFEALGYESASAKAEHGQLRRALDEAEQAVAKRRSEEQELLAEQRKVEGLLQAALLAFGNLKAQIQVSEFQFNEHLALHGPQAARTIAARKLLDDQTVELAGLAKTKDTLEDQQRDLRTKLRSFYAPRDQAQKKLAAFEKGLNDARRRDELYGTQGSAFFGLVPARWAFNVPGLDFLAPKGVPGRQEIKQVVLPDVRVEMNFLDSYATDRCITCHVGIDNPAMTPDAFAAKIEAAALTINEQRVAAGKEPLKVDLPAAPGSTPEAPKYLTFAELTHAQKGDYLDRLAKAINEYLRSQGRPEIEYRQPLLAHPELDLYVSPDSPHPMNRMGCTVCHEGNGQETDFVLASHMAADHHQEEEWAEKYYVRQAGLPENTFHVAHEFWERPMLLKKHTAASCAKCHSLVSDLEMHDTEVLPSAERIVAGQELFTTLGCINCHAVEGLNDQRQVGPDLSHVGSKLTTDFLHRWIEYPKNFRPSTRMPHYFHQENNLPSSAGLTDTDPILRTETEVAAITHYLLTFSKPYTPQDPPEGLEGDAARGEELFTTMGCLACHANLAARDPTDTEKRTFAERWIIPELVHEGLSADEAKARFAGMDSNERVDFAYRRFTPQRRLEAEAAAAAERTAAQREGRDPNPARLYIPPAFTRFAPELSGMGTKLVPDAGDTERHQAGLRWLYDWLREPRHYSSYTKMPRLFRENYYWKTRDPAERRRQTDQDLVDVAAYLLSLRNDAFTPTALSVDSAHRAESRRLILDLLAGQNTESVSKAILEDRKVAPSDPYGMLTERIIRGVSRSYAPGAEGEAAAYQAFARQDLADRQLLFLGSKMITHYGCSACHLIPGFETATRPGTELTTWARKLIAQLDFAFFAPGFHEDREAQPGVFERLIPQGAEFEPLVRDTGENPKVDVHHTHASFAYHKLRNPRIWDRAKLKRPYEKLKMPNFYLSEDETTSLVTFLLSRQESLVADALKVDYQDTPVGRVARGRSLVQELNCIGCHSIEPKPANVHQYFVLPDPASGELRFDVTNAPPNLHGEGAKVQYPWLFSFLNNVEMLRPWLKIRMPSFYLDHEQTSILVDYFAGLSQDEADMLATRLAEVHRAVVKAEPDKPVDWFTQPTLQTVAGWLSRYALRFGQVMPFELDTGTAGSPDEANQILRDAFGKIATRGGFLHDLLDVPYPFLEPGAGPVPTERYQAGRDLLVELKCLACHVAGDPFAEGTTTDIKAPNLALAAHRLQYEWIHKWLLDPQVIQPGTNMPQLFVEGLSAFKDFPEADKANLEARYGSDGGEQMRLLTDFLSQLGRGNDTVIQPPAPPQAAPPPSPAGQQPMDFESEFEDDSKPAGKPPASQPAEAGKKPADAEEEFEP